MVVAVFRGEYTTHTAYQLYMHNLQLLILKRDTDVDAIPLA